MRLAWRSANGSGPVKRTLSRPMPAPARKQRCRADVAARASGSRSRENSSAARARAELGEDRRVVLHGPLGLLRRHPAPADDAVAADDVALPDLKFEALALLVLQFSRLVEAGRERVALDLAVSNLASDFRGERGARSRSGIICRSGDAASNCRDGRDLDLFSRGVHAATAPSTRPAGTASTAATPSTTSPSTWSSWGCSTSPRASRSPPARARRRAPERTPFVPHS
jgi:hypothetical protein